MKEQLNLRVGSKAWENFCMDTNLLAKDAEKSGNFEYAIQLYESVVDAKFDGNLPYDRLCILYRKNNNYQKEYDVLQKAISIFGKLSKNSKREDTKQKLEKFKARKCKLLELANKKGFEIKG